MTSITRKKSGINLFTVCNYVLLCGFALMIMLPFLIMVSTSMVSQAEAVSRTLILFPQKFDFNAYKHILIRSDRLLKAYSVTLFRVTVGVAFNIFFTATYAFVISRRKLPYIGFFTYLVFLPIVITPGLIPTFLVVRFSGLYNTLWALIVPAAINPFWLLIMRNFFYTIPEELEESAVLDGASPWQVLWHLFLPLSLPSLATISLFYAVWHWNQWFDALLYITNQGLHPVQNILREIMQNAMTSTSSTEVLSLDALPPSESIQSAVIIVTTLPIVLVYPFIQKYFVKGALVGAVKG